MRERQTIIQYDKVMAMKDTRQKMIASAMLVNVNIGSIHNFMNYIAEVGAIPRETLAYTEVAKANMSILLDAMTSQIRDKEKKAIRSFMDTMRLPHHNDNLVEFLIKVLHGERNIKDFGEATELLKKDIEGESNPKLVMPAERSTQ